ncbi:MAG: hypothetical protein LBV33_04690, partial [Lachnospiraceae bacterium]|nr:hypothetical protein [Lachnospiraceae bacterium]
MKKKIIRATLLFVFTIFLALSGNPLNLSDNMVIMALAADIPDLKPGPLPESVDLSVDPLNKAKKSPYFPEIGNQGNWGACASWATTYYQYSYAVASKLYPDELNAQGESDYVFSPKWTYNYLNPTGDEEITGTSESDNYHILQTMGAARWSSFSYATSRPGANNLEWCDDPEERRQALETRVSAYYREIYGSPANLTPISGYQDPDLDKMKNLLNSGYIIQISTDDFDGWYSPNGWGTKDIINEGYGEEIVTQLVDAPGRFSGHAVVIVGYDDSIEYDFDHNGIIEEFERGAFKIANSHGLTYGNRGFMWIMYDAMNRESNSDADAYNQVNRKAIFSDYAYHWIKVAEYDLNSTVEITLTGAKRDDVMIQVGSQRVIERLGGPYSFNGKKGTVSMHTFLFDIGDESAPLTVKIGDLNDNEYPTTVESLKFIRDNVTSAEYTPKRRLNGITATYTEGTINTDREKAKPIYAYGIPEIAEAQGVTSTQLQYYYVEASTAGTYTFYSTQNTGDPCAWLYDASWAPLGGGAYDDGGLGQNFKITRELAQGERVYIAAGSPDSTPAYYSIAVNKLEAELLLDTPERVELIGNPKYQPIKSYEFTAPSTGSYVFTVSDLVGGQLITMAAITDMVVTNNYNYRGNEKVITRNLIAGETIFIEASVGSGITTTYTLTVTRNITPINIDESLRVTLSAPEHKEYYSFTPTESGYYIFTSSGAEITGGGYVDIGGGSIPNWVPLPTYITEPMGTLYDSQKSLKEPVSSKEIVSGPYGKSDLVVLYLLDAGEAYLFEAGGRADSTGAYTLTLTKDTTISLDVPVRVTVDQQGQKRYYNFTPQKTGTYILKSSNREISGGGWMDAGGGTIPSWVPLPTHITEAVVVLDRSDMTRVDIDRMYENVTGPYGSSDFTIYYTLVAGQTYHFEAGCVTTGAYTLTLTQDTSVSNGATITR